MVSGLCPTAVLL